MTVERGKLGREIVVHAETEEEAIAHAQKRYTGWTFGECIELIGEKHFTISLLEPD